MRRCLVLLLAVLALPTSFAAAAPSAPPPRAARYVLVESRKSVSPAGERASAVRGAVTVLGGIARWDLETGTFPRSKANGLILDERGGWLLDRKTPVAARVSPDDVRALFVPHGEGDSGPFQSAVRDVEVPSAQVGPGPAFEGKATARLRVKASWSLVTSSPGRVSHVRCRLAAVIDTLEETPDETRSPLDDLGRLLDVPAPVREALASELARTRGLPVGVVIETDADLGVDYPGGPASPPDERKPLKTRTETRRTVSELVSRPAVERDAAELSLSEETRVVGLERLVEPPETLR